MNRTNSENQLATASATRIADRLAEVDATCDQASRLGWHLTASASAFRAAFARTDPAADPRLAQVVQVERAARELAEASERLRAATTAVEWLAPLTEDADRGDLPASA